MPDLSAPLAVRLYSAAANFVAPFAYRRVAAKLEAQGTSPDRLPERMGYPSMPRPAGRLMWFHAASVGESLSVLGLIDHIGQTMSDLSFLITSGTATSAQVVAKRLPQRCTHQFAPLDSRKALSRFLDHWKPNAAVFVESELWPQMLRQSRAAGVPLALINARISENSARNWQKLRGTAQYLMQHFNLIHCQDARTTDLLHGLGLQQARQGVNLKSISGALPYNHEEFERMRDVIGARPVWLAASTHDGEEDIMLQAHRSMIRVQTDALLIVAPRHPERGDRIEKQIAEAGFHAARRSNGMAIDFKTQVYLADTLGEMGLWYALAPLTCVGGSFTDVGGHNPFEPASAGSAVVHGPLYANFEQSYKDMAAAQACIEVSKPDDLRATLVGFLSDPDGLNTMRDNAKAFASAQENVLDGFANDLCKALMLR